MRIDARFCGPPTSGNGGYTAGRLASFFIAQANESAATSEGAIEVTLRAPPPLETELGLEMRADGAVLLGADGTLIAEAKPATLELELPGPVTWEEAHAATERYVGFREHPYPGCFVCGPRRASESGPGLGLFPGATHTSWGRPVAAAPFAPAADLADGEGLLRPEFVWAALDCPSWFGHAAFVESVPKILLGRLTVRVHRRPRAGVGDQAERCVAVGWSLGKEGRRITCGSALYDAQGECLAQGQAVWIELKPPS